VLHVIENPMLWAGPETASVDFTAVQKDMEAGAHAALDKIVTAEDRTQLKAVTAVRSGPPAIEIIGYARDASADVIIMGTHGRGLLGHLFMGSVAERVVRIAVGSVRLGELPRGAYATLIVKRIGAQGARGHAVEFCGSTIASLSVEGRMTICNMILESGARAGLIAPDAKTVDYVLQRATDIDSSMQVEAKAYWATLRSDADARFDVEHVFDAAEIAPYVTWGTSPDQAMPIDACIPTLESVTDATERTSMEQALRYTGLSAGASLEGLPVQRVFIGSCTNARIEDLRLVAHIAKGRKVAVGVRAMVVPGSGAVRQQAEAEGIADILINAGFEWRKPGCSMCLAMNDDVLAPGERCASTTNRNFEGRQGRGGITHLMSPSMAAAAAITGHITDVRKLGAGA